jgi:hypothetical protein
MILSGTGGGGGSDECPAICVYSVEVQALGRQRGNHWWLAVIGEHRVRHQYLGRCCVDI